MSLRKRKLVRINLDRAVILGGLLLLACWRPAFSLSEQWYVGIGGGVSFLQPNPLDTAVDNNDSTADSFHLFLGKDLSELASLQLGVNSLGAVDFPAVSEVSYYTLDASILYRFYDSRDRQLVRGNQGLSLYALVGIGGVSRDASPDLDLKNNSVFFLNYGGGAELFLGRGVSLRLQGAVIDEDAQQVGISLVTRFGGREAKVRPPAQSVPGSIPRPLPQSLPGHEAVASTTPETLDSDLDGVADDADECAGSGADFPVNAIGCPRLSGIIDGVKFIPGTAQFTAAALPRLVELARLLREFPNARFVLLAHTDNLLEPRDQAILTRERLKNLAGYLQRNGIRGSQLVLRARGGASPVFDNTTAEGRERNNRIEVNEFR